MGEGSKIDGANILYSRTTAVIATNFLKNLIFKGFVSGVPHSMGHYLSVAKHFARGTLAKEEKTLVGLRSSGKPV